MFDIKQAPIDEYGDWDNGGGVDDYCDDLMQAFADSPEGEAYYEYNGTLGWTHSFLYYSLAHLGTLPHQMTQRDADEVLYSLIPRKVSTEADSASEIVTELRAFWEFAEREYKLRNAATIIKSLDADAEERLKWEFSNPDNFGMAKSLMMMGQGSGFDMTTQEGLNEFMLAYNVSVLESKSPAADVPESVDYLPPSQAKTKKPPVTTANLSADERKAREKLRRKKLGKRKRRK